jgi:PPP family 3-phenylpropionic acid transporter
VTVQFPVLPGGLSIRLAGFYFAYFAMVGVIMPYWPVWLQSRGLGPVEIGIVLAAARWISVGTTPFIAQFADRRGELKRLLLVLMSGVVAGYAINSFSYGFWPILLVMACTAVFNSAVVPVGESLTMMHASRGHIDYGRVRLWGSVSFICTAFLGGELLANWTPDVILWTIVACGAGTVVAILFMPDTRSEPTPRQRGAFRRLIRQPTLLLFLGTAALLSSSHAVLYAFGTIHWRAAGIDDRIIGLLWAEGVIAEILLFMVGGAFMRRIRPADAMMLAAAGGILRWTVLGYTTDTAALFAVQGLHALTFGAAHLGAMAFVTRAAPEGFRATVQSLYNALGMGAAAALAILLSGPLYEAAGAQAFYLMSALSFAGGIAALVLRRHWDGNRIELPAARSPTAAS